MSFLSTGSRQFREGFYANKLLKRLVNLESFRAGQSLPFFIFIKKSEVKKEECKKNYIYYFFNFVVVSAIKLYIKIQRN